MVLCPARSSGVAAQEACSGRPAPLREHGSRGGGAWEIGRAPCFFGCPRVAVRERESLTPWAFGAARPRWLRVAVTRPLEEVSGPWTVEWLVRPPCWDSPGFGALTGWEERYPPFCELPWQSREPGCARFQSGACNFFSFLILNWRMSTWRYCGVYVFYRTESGRELMCSSSKRRVSKWAILLCLINVKLSHAFCHLLHMCLFYWCPFAKWL